MNEKYFFKDENGDLIEFTSQIVCVFDTEDDVKYMVYTDNKKNDLDELIVYGVIIGNDNILTPIQKEDYYLIEDSISMLREKYGNMNLGGLNNG